MSLHAVSGMRKNNVLQAVIERAPYTNSYMETSAIAVFPTPR
jgi:hypothetical protein